MRQKDRRKTENIKFCWRRQRQPQHTFGGKQRGSRAEDYFIWLVVWNVLDVLSQFLSTIIWVFFVSTKVRFIQYLTHLKPPARRWNPYILGPRFSCPKVSVSVHPACFDPWKCKKKKLRTMALDAACWQATRKNKNRCRLLVQTWNKNSGQVKLMTSGVFLA